MNSTLAGVPVASVLGAALVVFAVFAEVVGAVRLEEITKPTIKMITHTIITIHAHTGADSHTRLTTRFIAR